MYFENDAFGHALMNHFEGKSAHELIERSDGYMDVSAGADTYFAEPTGQQCRVVEHAVGRVLDVGCGAGRHALYLQKRGREVVGIDVSPLAIDVCRRRGLRDARVMAVEEVDRSLGKFDSVVMLGNNLGLLGSAARAKRVLTRLHRVVLPGGRLIASLDGFRALSPEAVEDFMRVNQGPRTVERMGRSRSAVELVDDSVLKSLRGRGPDGFFRFWDQVRERFDGVTTIVTLSRPGFDHERNAAFLVASYSCGLACGAGYDLLLRRESGGWSVVRMIQTWTS